MSEARVVGSEAWYKTAEWCGGEPARGFGNRYLFIFADTPTGWVKAREGDAIIKGDDGRFLVERDGEVVLSYDGMRPARAKRLTDAELAAEYWKLAEQCRYEQWIESVRAFDGDELSDWEKAGAERKYAALDTLYRFATTPHALDAD